MLRNCLLLTAAFTGITLAAPAGASADMSVEPSWQLIHRSFSGGDNMALLGPGNDTRVNMILLFSDRSGGAKIKAAKPKLTSLSDYWTLRTAFYPLPDGDEEPRYSYSGSRCDSNEGATADFIDAIRAEMRLSAEERNTLVANREALNPDCESAGASAGSSSSGAFTSPLAKDFATYLRGATAFYAGDYMSAQSSFETLIASQNEWLKEASTYLLGRVALNQAMTNAFGEWGDFDQEKVNESAAAAAGKAFGAYLSQYPNGQYSNSARGLMRRVHWLGTNADALAADYSALVSAPGKLDYAKIAEEIDLKLLPWLTSNTVADPVLLATIDLKRMRSADSFFGEGLLNTPLSLDELKGQRDRFSSNPALFEYLVAAHQFYVGNNPKEVLKLIPDAAKNPNFSYLDFSRQMLCGMALEATGDRNARGFWLEMIGGAKQPMQREAVELAIALHDERAGQLNKIFDAQSQIRSPEIREILLYSVAGPDLLRAQARNKEVGKKERDVALYTLLYKSLTRGAYRDFVSDVKLVPQGAPNDTIYWGLDYYSEEPSPIPLGQFTNGTFSDDYACPNISQTALALSLNPKQPKSLLCLGDFIRLNGFDNYWMDESRKPEELGGGRSYFPGTYQPRQAIYQRLIADPSVTGDDKAYALYRAVWCYGPSGYNSCGGDEVSASVRKGWYNRLKREYPTSKWAKSLKYYW